MLFEFYVNTAQRCFDMELKFSNYGMSILFYQRKILYSCKLLMNVRVVFSAFAPFRPETVEQLTGSNFPKWKNAMELCLAFSEFDYTLIRKTHGTSCSCRGV
jgi:hypothetical protein